MNVEVNLTDINTLIITGAGFSKDAGLPLEKDIIPKGLEYCNKYHPELIDNINKDLIRVLGIKHIHKFTIEEILTKLQIEEYFSPENKDYLKDIFPLESGILALFSKTLKIKSPEKLPDYYYNFVKTFNKRTAFITFNNDFLLETIFKDLKYYWTYLIEEEIENDLTYKDYYYKSSQSWCFNKKPMVTSYLKLHGSFNWHYCWACNNVRITQKYFGVSGEPFSLSDRFTQVCQKCRNDAVMKPLIIPPTLIKYYNLDFIRRLWFNYHKLLRQVENIIIIGTSLRDEDVLLLDSLSFIKGKNPSLKKLVFINLDHKLVTKCETITNFKVQYYPVIEDYLSQNT